MNDFKQGSDMTQFPFLKKKYYSVSIYSLMIYMPGIDPAAGNSALFRVD